MVIIFLLLGSLFQILTISNSVNETKHPHAERSLLGKNDKPGYVHDEKSLHNNTDLNERFNAQEQLIQSILTQIEAMKGQANSTEENKQMNTGEKQAQEDLRKKLDEEKSKRSDLENKISLFDEKSKTQEQLIQFLSTQMERVDVRNISSTQPVAVFYNVFSSKIEDLDYVMHDIVKEQMHMIIPKLHDVYVRSIGMPFSFEFLNQGNPSKGDLSITRIQHDSTGNEVGTLKLLWDYCNLNPEKSVVYLHSKGSFTRKKRNDQLRKFITRGALSEECANIPNSCNVCSSRFSPVPHPHTSGNMWLAKCSYVKNLLDPLKFEKAMNKIPRIRRRGFPLSCPGRGRFAAEHWIHSHPSVKPCDVSDDPSFVWGYAHVPKPDFKIDLKPAPRFNLTTYFPPDRRVCGKFGLVKEDRLVEYRELYGEEVPDSWWGFDLFNDVDVQALLRVEEKED